MSAPRTTTVLIAALGGEGGGVLAGWLVDAADRAGHWVQQTSIPGVAQRTGATTYYIEIMARTAGDDRQPIMALTASPGNVDVMVASELLEAGRALENGFVTPDRTTLIASTHRIFSMAEKTAMGDGRYDAERVRRAAEQMAAKQVLFDMRAVAEQAGTVINAVLFGAMAGANVLPLSRESLEDAIRASGIAVDASLAGFELGFGMAQGDRSASPGNGDAHDVSDDDGLGDRTLTDRINRNLPGMLQELAREGARRLIDYQGVGYARFYLDRLEPIAKIDATRGGAARQFSLSREVTRRLALWMAFEDLIRVADLKIRPDRVARVRAEVKAAADEPVTITEFLKPGVDEVASLLPPGLGRWAIGLADRAGVRYRLNVGMHVSSTRLRGFLPMWLLSRLRGWRPRTLRFAEEQARIERWLKVVQDAVEVDYDLAREIAVAGKVVRGYSDTHRRGIRNFGLLMDAVPECVIARSPAKAFARLRDAALADPEGDALDQALASMRAEATGSGARAGG